MRTVRFSRLLMQDGWKDNVSLSIDDSGKIISFVSNPPEALIEIHGPAIPGFINCHSHAFQYAMAGLAENINPHHDDFWSWREIMYSIARFITPQQLFSIAAMLYSEMLRNGFTHVVEFHYLHHDPSGAPYSQLTEMSEQLLRAAESVGIGITLVPIFYQKGGFGLDPDEAQKRFISGTLEEYSLLVDGCTKLLAQFENSNIGYGIHSLRAVDPEDVIKCFDKYEAKGPFHLHISEQPKEVEECLNFHGMRPVEWLLNNIDVSENTHLVHATHLVAGEINKIVGSGAHVVLCPSTEGNLGDGIFPFEAFKKNGGKYSIGTDSHIGLSPMEELRWLDYQQRLVSNKRAYLEDQGSIGDQLYKNSVSGG